MKRNASQVSRAGVRLRNKLADLTEIPEENLSRESTVYVLGNEKAEISGCSGVLEYSNTCIVLKTRHGIVNVQGTELELCLLLKDQMIVRGEISSVVFSAGEGDAV